jgi:hypothetical protein
MISLEDGGKGTNRFFFSGLMSLKALAHIPWLPSPSVIKASPFWHKNRPELSPA